MTRITQIRLFLLVAVILVYGQVITHDFVNWDDKALIFANKNVTDPTTAGVIHSWNPSNPDNVAMYNPLVFTLWWSIAHFSAVDSPDIMGATINPYNFHLASLIAHILCVYVVLEILRRLKIRDWAAATGALIFAIHPLQTEAVAWATAMKDLLSTLFALLAIWGYIAALDAQGRRRKNEYWLSTLFFAAALLSKPSTVILPLIVGAIDFLIYRRPWKKIAAWTAPWYAMSIAITLIAAQIQASSIQPISRAPLWARPLIALDALAFYLYKLLVPISLRIDYGRSPPAVMHNPSLHHPLYWTWIFPVLLAVLILRTKRRPLILAGAIFVLALLPVLGLKTFAFQYFTTVADRYMYFPMLGVALAVGLWMNTHKTRLAAISATAVLIVFASLSFVQAQRWTDTETLYTYALDHTNAIHEVILGRYQDDLAVPYARRGQYAAQIGDLSQEQENIDKTIAFAEKAMTCYRTAIRLDPTDTNGYDLLARDQVRLNQIPQAIDTIKAWLAVEPRTAAGAREDPGRLQGMLGSLYLRNHQFPQAIQALNQSLAEKEDPDIRRALDLAEKLASQSTRPTTAPTTPR